MLYEVITFLDVATQAGQGDQRHDVLAEREGQQAARGIPVDAAGKRNRPSASPLSPKEKRKAPTPSRNNFV